jgi:transposase-like protein
MTMPTGSDQTSTVRRMADRIAELEQENAALKRQIAELRGAVEVLLAPSPPRERMANSYEGSTTTQPISTS